MKSLAAWAAALFSAHQVMTLADEWSNVAARVLNVTSGVAEQTAAMDALQKTAESTGQSFEGLGSLFTTMQANRDTLGYTTDQVQQLTDVIGELVTVSGATGEQGRGLMNSLEGVFSVNQLTLRQVRSMPELGELLAKAYGGMPKFLELVKAGHFTAKMLAEGLIGQRAEIARMFLNMPVTFGRAFTTIRTYFGGLIYDVGKSTGVWTTMARGIITSTDWIIGRIRWLKDEFGGWRNLLTLVGIAFAVAFGPTAVGMIGALAKALLGVTWQWLLMAGLIALIGLAIQDFWVWTQGGDSIFGDIFGPWEDNRATVLAWRDTALDALRSVWGLLGELNGLIHQVAVAFGAPVDWTWLGAAQSFVDTLKEALRLIHEITDMGSAKQQVTLSDSAADRLGKPREEGGPRSDFVQLLTDWQRAHRIDWFDKLRDVPDKSSLLKRGVADYQDAKAGTSVLRPWLSGLVSTPVAANPAAPIPMDAPPVAAPDADSQGGIGRWLRSLVSKPVAANPAALIAPAALAPQITQSTTVTGNNTTVNVTTTSDTPAAVGAAAASGANSGWGAAIGRYFGLAQPGAEFGLAQ